jgi:hypothetical protein
VKVETIGQDPRIFIISEPKDGVFDELIKNLSEETELLKRLIQKMYRSAVISAAESRAREGRETLVTPTHWSHCTAAA